MFSNLVFQLKGEHFLALAGDLLDTNFAAGLSFAGLLFLAGLLGMIFNYNNFLVTMMSVELMYLGIITSFVIYATYTGSTEAQVFALLVLILAACESAVGLGILISIHRFGGSIRFFSYEALGG